MNLTPFIDTLHTYWIKEEKMYYREGMIEDLESAPSTLIGLLNGENFGKRTIRV